MTYTSAHGLPASVLWGFTGDEAGNLWVLSGERILRWDPSRERFVDVEGPKVSRGYGIMTWSERGGFWAVAPEGLRRFVGGTFELHPVPQAVIGDAVYLAEEQDGTLWTATTDGRVARIETQMHGRVPRLEGDPPRHADSGGRASAADGVARAIRTIVADRSESGPAPLPDARVARSPPDGGLQRDA